MFCSQCGCENPEGNDVCVQCGSYLPGTTPAASAAPPAAGSAAEPTKTSGLAIASFVMALICLTCVAWPLLFLPAILCGIIALVKISGSQGRLKGSALAVVGIVIPVMLGVIVPMLLAILMPVLVYSEADAGSPYLEVADETICSTNLQGLGNAMIVYANDYDGQFPTADQWCDLLMTEADVSEQSLKCPEAPEVAYAYAFNQAMAGKDDGAAGNVVLLFEAELGKNGVGGPQDLVLRHPLHGRDGCNILFVDGHVEYITEDRLSGLKWQP